METKQKTKPLYFPRDLKFFCGNCGKDVIPREHKRYFTKAFYAIYSRVIYVSYVCPHCSSFCDIAWYCNNKEYADDFLDKLALYATGRTKLENPLKKKYGKKTNT